MILFLFFTFWFVFAVIDTIIVAIGIIKQLDFLRKSE
jgi:hypothetical protein